MKQAEFIIDNRFTVDRFRNEVLDKESGLKSRIEPRLMKLLCLLADHGGSVVKRELIVKEIWDDYPGANEGLNQAISFLRKLLADENKQIIKTIPKEGYSFHAIISQKNDDLPVNKRKYGVLIAAAVVLLLALFFMAGRYYAKKETHAITTKELGEKDAANTSRMDSIHQAGQMKQAADLSRKDSIHHAEQMKKFAKDTIGAAAKGDSVR